MFLWARGPARSRSTSVAAETPEVSAREWISAAWPGSCQIRCTWTHFPIIVCHLSRLLEGWKEETHLFWDNSQAPAWERVSCLAKICVFLCFLPFQLPRKLWSSDVSVGKTEHGVSELRTGVEWCSNGSKEPPRTKHSTTLKYGECITFPLHLWEHTQTH